MNYFDKLPIINYKGHSVRNILARSKIDDRTKNNKMVYYPYTLTEGDRADIISDYYYGSPGYSWLVWMSNEIVDPYYGMPMTEADFTDFIMSKYGSIKNAMRKIKFYRNNWSDHPGQITVAEYKALEGRYKKYYDPVVDLDYNPIAYYRRKDDETVSTNRIVILTIESDAPFKVGEEVRADANNYGFVTFSSTTSVTLNNITGQFSADSSVVGEESGIMANVISVSADHQTVAAIDALYWSPVSFYEYEREVNIEKKDINLIDVRYRSQIENDHKQTMNE